ncbi:phosphatase PAP2 family protein [Pseudorhodoferax sp. Leaf267]|uniref:phosphatase PAP2 family protein n=1 Tax=Pseudorhodoferax sp. Leaf267 TaxID=1736316 RepID=UPI0006FBC440|nr:phosphatase PAP2 family protein [Pseudorhodoferax sp. Leaf267]KQP18011.1 hypothetical protein ASF43_09135 [Pseudorhodoferax sp. Leaf267]
MHTPSLPSRAPLWPLLAALPLLAAWDLSGLDLTLAHAAGTAAGFALREHWLLTTVLHQGGRAIAWALALALVLAVWWPVGALQRLSYARRLQLAVTPMVITALVGLLKSQSGTSCPWSLAEFGGITPYQSHWLDFLASGGARGHCFPAGHAMAGFCFVGGYWVFRDQEPRLARIWLAAALGAGLLLGVGQQLRGAHFMSHTLWSGWIACAAALAVDTVRWRNARGAPSAAMGVQS